MRSSRILPLIVLFCCFSFSQDKPILAFVQITDAHVFDDGWKQSTDSGYQSVSDDWFSLYWAVKEINGMVEAGKHIDFVVYTGDLGLSNVELGKECGVHPTKVNPLGLPPISKDWAVDKIAEALATLKVSTVYFVPGNNDLEDELVADVRRPSCFVGFVQSALTKLASPVTITELRTVNTIMVNGFRLAGLNSASFKKAENYEGCSPAEEGCPDAEISSLRKLVFDPSNDSILLFTHIPDLIDPFREANSWTITDPVRKKWIAAACSDKVIGIFAGHFHDSNRGFYGSTAATHDLVERGSECVANKTWVAPPLAIKNQVGKNPTARGLLYVRIFKGGEIKVVADWFGGR